MAKTKPTRRATGRSPAKKSATKATRGSGLKGKVGGTADAARRFGGKLDFGTPSRKAHPADHRVKVKVDERQSTRNGPEGLRQVGVSAVGYDPGHSGGAADTDIIGVGTQGGSTVSTDGTLGQRRGRDLTTRGGSAPFASGRRSKSTPDLVGRHGASKRVRGTTHNAGEA